jgi:tryptophan synthase alpha chain
MNEPGPKKSEDRFRRTFSRTHPKPRCRVIPYFTAGFPDAETVEALMREADALGVPVIELGIPYSDSIADGPVIQSSFYHALDRGFRVNDALALVERLRHRLSSAVAMMLSYSIVYRLGVDAFLKRAAAAGYDGVIIPDVPLEEGNGMCLAARAAGLACVGMVAPTTDRERRADIARRSTGFVYVIATAGTTGARTTLACTAQARVRELRTFTDLPLAVGFGVSTPEQVRDVCTFADAAIVGSAIISRIEEARADGATSSQIVSRVRAFLAELVG